MTPNAKIAELAEQHLSRPIAVVESPIGRSVGHLCTDHMLANDLCLPFGYAEENVRGFEKDTTLSMVQVCARQQHDSIAALCRFCGAERYM